MSKLGQPESRLGTRELAHRRHERAVLGFVNRVGGFVASAHVEESMASYTSPVTTMFLEKEFEKPPVSAALAQAEGPTTMRRDQPRALEVAQCSLCGIALPLALLVPDGGRACTDIRWYCKDAMSCTTRWTTASAPRSEFGQASAGWEPDFTSGRSSEQDARV
jgi:hypothetical protein